MSTTGADGSQHQQPVLDVVPILAALQDQLDALAATARAQQARTDELATELRDRRPR